MDTFLWNRENVVSLIETYERHLGELKRLIAAVTRRHENNWIRPSTSGTSYTKTIEEDLGRWLRGRLPRASVEGHSIVPGDKSVTHRAIILTALAEGGEPRGRPLSRRRLFEYHAPSSR